MTSAFDDESIACQILDQVRQERPNLAASLGMVAFYPLSDAIVEAVARLEAPDGDWLLAIVGRVISRSGLFVTNRGEA